MVSDAVTASALRGRVSLFSKPGLILLGLTTLIVLAMHFDNTPKAQIRSAVLNLEVARSQAERERGLSGREYITPIEAMLFIFDDPNEHCMWMKDMKFSIDILWFDESLTMVHQERNVAPDTYPRSFCPDQAAKYVVEVDAGVSDHFKMQEGDKLQLFKL